MGTRYDPHPNPRLHTFYLLFKQLHVMITTSIIVVCISMEIQVFKNLFDAK